MGKVGPKEGYESADIPPCRVLLVEEAAALQRQGHGQAVRVTGRITALDKGLNSLTLCGLSVPEVGRGSEGCNTAAQDLALRVRLDAVRAPGLAVGSLCQVGGELEWDEGRQRLVFVARFGRCVDGLHKSVFIRALGEARLFWEEEGFTGTKNEER